MCSLLSWCYSSNQSFLSTLWQSGCVTALTNCSSHSEEPVCPLSVPGIRGTLSTLRFSLRDVSQPQQKGACPNTGCGPLCGEPIGLFTACHNVNASSKFQCVWWPQNNILLLSTCFFFLFWQSQASHGWLAWCVIAGLAIVKDLINHVQH